METIGCASRGDQTDNSSYSMREDGKRAGDLGLVIWKENRWMALGYRNFECEVCSSRIWKVAFVVGCVDNTNGGLCPGCSNYVDGL